jgi:hypothetical protein
MSFKSGKTLLTIVSEDAFPLKLDAVMQEGNDK